MKKIDTKINPQESSFWASLILPMDLVMVAGCSNTALMSAELRKNDESEAIADDSVDKRLTPSDIGEAA